MPAKKSISYLALGDSYTIGESVLPSFRFPSQLVVALSQKDVIVSESKIIATTGWTTSDLLSAIEKADISDRKYDLVSLLIGVNNQYQGKSLEEYKEEFTLLLNKSIHLTGGRKERVFVLSIPDYGFTPFGKEKQEIITREIDAFNKVNKSVTDLYKVRYFDITPISRDGIKTPSLIASDGLHPSPDMYYQWIEMIKEEVYLMIVR